MRYCRWDAFTERGQTTYRCHLCSAQYTGRPGRKRQCDVQRLRGLGDWIALFTGKLKVKKCKPCNRRQNALNRASAWVVTQIQIAIRKVVRKRSAGVSGVVKQLDDIQTIKNVNQQATDNNQRA